MRRRALLFALLYVGVIAYLSLFPGSVLPVSKGSGLTWVPMLGRRQWGDFGLNILFYVPLGVSLSLGMGAGWLGSLAVTFVGFLLSATTETLQLWIPGRFSTYNDLLSNSIGTAVGAVATGALRGQMVAQFRKRAGSWELRPLQTLFLTLWMLWRCFPLFPRVSWFRVSEQLLHPAAGTWTEAWYSLGGFAVLRYLLGSSPWLAVAGGAVLAAPLMEQHTLTLAACAGTLAGWVLTRRHPAPKTLAWGLLVLIVAEELRPYRLEGPAGEFGWMPLASWFEADANSYYSLIFSRIFVYTACAWAWRSLAGARAWTPAIPCAVLLLAEWAQRYLPGRTPEITDPVLMLAGWVLVVLVGQSEEARSEN